VRKNILFDFRNYAAQLVARHPARARKFMASAYGIGDGLVVTVPLIRNGFFQTVMHARPDWHLLVAAYGHDPVPAIVSVAFVASSVVVSKRFALGHVGYGSGALALAINLLLHHEPWTAVAMLPSVVGGTIGASYKYLEEKYGHANNSFIQNTVGSPKRLAGFCFLFTSAPTIFTSLREKLLPLFGSGLCWTSGNCTSMLLPRDDQTSPESPRQSLKNGSSGRDAKLDRA